MAPLHDAWDVVSLVRVGGSVHIDSLATGLACALNRARSRLQTGRASGHSVACHGSDFVDDSHAMVPVQWQDTCDGPTARHGVDMVSPWPASGLGSITWLLCLDPIAPSHALCKKGQTARIGSEHHGHHGHGADGLFRDWKSPHGDGNASRGVSTSMGQCAIVHPQAMDENCIFAQYCDCNAVAEMALLTVCSMGCLHG